MITKTDLKKELIQNSKTHNIIQWSTGTGKTASAIALCEKFEAKKVLVIIPLLTLIDNWKEEFHRWCKNDMKCDFITYVSFPKKTNGEILQSYDVIIADECHHLTERCRTHLLQNRMYIKHFVALSATIPFGIYNYISAIFPGVYKTDYKLRTAIDNETLPDPDVYLIPMKLDNLSATELVYISEHKKNPKWNDRVVAYAMINEMQDKYGINCYTRCTPKQASMYYDEQIRIHKNDNKSFLVKVLGSKRLAFLANQKTEIVKQILKILKDRRVLTFCNSIEQAEAIGGYQVHSKSSKGVENLNKFNEKKIKHITTVKQVDEGINLTSCEFLVYANLNSSEKIIDQRLGRGLRHKAPKVIIPYFVDTRDESLVFKMRKNYNPSKIHLITDLNDLSI